MEGDDGSLPALTERIAELTAAARARFDQAVPLNQPAAPLSIEKSSASATDDVGPSAASTRHASDATAVDDVPASEAVARPPEVIDLRGVDLGVPKVKDEAGTDTPDNPTPTPAASVPAAVRYFEE